MTSRITGTRRPHAITLPAKFSATIKEAIGREPERPSAYANLEQRPQRCAVMPVAPNRVKAYIAARVGVAA